MRKFLVLGILFVFLTVGLAFVQEQQQEQGQAVPAPYLVLFGTQWDKCGIGPTQYFDDLRLRVGIVYVKDRNSRLGIMDLLVIGKDKDGPEIPIIGWKKSYTEEEQGFIFETGTLTKTQAENEALIYRLGKDQDGNPVLVFLHLKKGIDQPLFVKYIDLKKFDEEYLRILDN